MEAYFIEYLMNVMVIGLSVIGYILIFSKLRTRKPFYILNMLVTIMFLWLIDPHVFVDFPQQVSESLPLFIIKVLLILYFSFYFSLCIAIDFRILKGKRRDNLLGLRKYATVVNIVVCIVGLSLYVV